MEMSKASSDPLIDTDFGDYTIHQFVGRGTFGKVYRGTCKSAQARGGNTFIPTSLALKLIDLSKQSVNNKQRQWIEREIDILNDPDIKTHPNIVKYVEYFSQDKYLCIVMEFYEGGDLYSYVRNHEPLQERMFMEYLRQLINGLEFLHRKDIIHRDVKTKNILMSATNELKLGDFGVARKVEEVGMNLTKPVGTPNCMSPEMLERKEYDFKTDIWSLGCVCYEMATRQYAFTGSSGSAIHAKIRSRELPDISGIPYSQSVKQSMSKMLEINPTARPTALEVKNYVNEQLPITNMSLAGSREVPGPDSGIGSGIHSSMKSNTFEDTEGSLGSTLTETSNLEKLAAKYEAKIIRMIGTHNATGKLQKIMNHFNKYPNDKSGLKAKVTEVVGAPLAGKILPFVLTLKGVVEGIREMPGHEEEEFSTAPAE